MVILQYSIYNQISIFQGAAHKVTHDVDGSSLSAVSIQLFRTERMRTGHVSVRDI